MIKYSYTLNISDYINASVLNYKKSKSKWVFRALGLITLITSYSNNTVYLYSLILALLLLFFEYTLFRLIIYLKYYFVYKKHDSLSIHGNIDDKEIELVAAHQTSTMRWSAFFAYSLNKNTLLLHSKTTKNIFVPRSAFTTQHDWNSLIKLVKNKLDKK
jgi:hypothetical protein